MAFSCAPWSLCVVCRGKPGGECSGRRFYPKTRGWAAKELMDPASDDGTGPGSIAQAAQAPAPSDSGLQVVWLAAVLLSFMQFVPQAAGARLAGRSGLG